MWSQNTHTDLKALCGFLAIFLYSVKWLGNFPFSIQYLILQLLFTFSYSSVLLSTAQWGRYSFFRWRKQGSQKFRSVPKSHGLINSWTKWNLNQSGCKACSPPGCYSVHQVLRVTDEPGQSLNLHRGTGLVRNHIYSCTVFTYTSLCWENKATLVGSKWKRKEK